MPQYSRQPASQSSPDCDAGFNTADSTGGWTSGTYSIGWPATGGFRSHACVSFDLTSMNAASILSSAICSLYIYANNANGSGTNQMWREKRDWRNAYVRWSNYDNGVAWQTAGSLGANDIDTSATHATASVAQNPAQWTEIQHNFSAGGLTELKKMFDGTYTNYGWMFDMNAEGSGNACQHEYSAMKGGWGTGYHPKLVINYDIPSAPGVMIMGLFHLGEEAKHIRWSKKMKKILNPWDVPDWAGDLKPI